MEGTSRIQATHPHDENDPACGECLERITTLEADAEKASVLMDKWLGKGAAAMGERITTLEAALREYGKHKSDCYGVPENRMKLGCYTDESVDCSCGLDRALTPEDTKGDGR